jgi:hypothetical protein
MDHLLKSRTGEAELLKVWHRLFMIPTDVLLVILHFIYFLCVSDSDLHTFPVHIKQDSASTPVYCCDFSADNKSETWQGKSWGILSHLLSIVLHNTSCSFLCFRVTQPGNILHCLVFFLFIFVKTNFAIVNLRVKSLESEGVGLWGG